MGKFKYGTHVNEIQGKMKYLRISSGPLRGKYVHILVLEAKLGRAIREGYNADHINGDTLDCRPDNLEEVTEAENTRRMQQRTAARKAAVRHAREAIRKVNKATGGTKFDPAHLT